jgi:hypothetical protein
MGQFSASLCQKGVNQLASAHLSPKKSEYFYVMGISIPVFGDSWSYGDKPTAQLLFCRIC